MFLGGILMGKDVLEMEGILIFLVNLVEIERKLSSQVH